MPLQALDGPERVSQTDGVKPLLLPLVFLPLVACGDEPVASGPSAAAGSPASAPAAGPPAPAAARTGEVHPGTVDLARPPVTDDVSVDAAARCPGCDIVVITACSLRRDHVGAYGEIEGLTPNVDALAAEGVRFIQAYAASNFTLSSLTAILTGRFGSSTGVLGWGQGLGAGIPTLPEVLANYGYRTGAFTIDAPSGFRPDYGLDRGFQRMVLIAPPRDTPDGRHAVGEIGPGGAAARPAANWIAAQPADKPIFAMYHTRAAHFPFVISDEGVENDPTGVIRALWEEPANLATSQVGKPGMAGGNSRFGLIHAVGEEMAITRRAGAAGEAVWRSTYRASVARMDADFAAIREALAKRGRLDKTIVVVVADHGESLGDNGELLHGGSYFDNVIRVPLIMRVPGLSPRAEDALVSQVDILPTLLDLVGATPPAQIDGVSLVGLLDGGSDRVRSTALTEGGATNTVGEEPYGAVVSPPWVLLRQSFPCTSEFLDAPDDPPGAPPAGGPNGGAPGAPGAPLGPAHRDCLFNLEADPEQTRDLAAQEPARVEELLARWRGYREGVAGRAVPSELRLDPAFVELLHRTGYDFTQDTPVTPSR